MSEYFITKTRLYNFDALKPHFCIVKLGVTEEYIIFILLKKKHRLWVLVRTASHLTSTHNLYFVQEYEKYQNFYLLFSVFVVKIFNIFE